MSTSSDKVRKPDNNKTFVYLLFTYGHDLRGPATITTTVYGISSSEDVLIQNLL